MFILYFPKLAIETWKKKSWNVMTARFFPSPLRLSQDVRNNDNIVWIHSVSFGETVAVAPLVKELKRLDPSLIVITSHATKTGMEASQKLFPFADFRLFLPYDFIFSVRRLLKYIPKISCFIHSEGDVWPCMVSELKKRGAKAVIVNGKLSSRSFKRYMLFPRFARWIFGSIDLFCLQTDEFLNRYRALGVSEEKMVVTGNMKADVDIKILSEPEKQDLVLKLKLKEGDSLIVLGSTHTGEEKEIVKELIPYMEPHIKVAIVPRHPHRFQEVFASLKADFPEKKVALFSELVKNPHFEGGWNIVIIDMMGILTSLYQIASASVVCGSFVSHIGGHNILEPAAVRSPVFVGPYMHSQQWLYDSAVKHRAIMSHKTAKHMARSIYNLLSQEKIQKKMASNAYAWAQKCRGATVSTCNNILRSCSLSEKVER